MLFLAVRVLRKALRVLAARVLPALLREANRLLPVGAARLLSVRWLAGLWWVGHGLLLSSDAGAPRCGPRPAA
ncbi:hypothetical protein [Saccharomonospora sp.]|uniref:hypothetical protein n=1 Tax=Saccharomonospora sp. TaxID=33913 RepID=UPI0026164D8A|nr:hypothetical protein [Saccharomonospora sp.]